MSAWPCCGEYNEHAEDCITLKLKKLQNESQERDELRAEVADLKKDVDRLSGNSSIARRDGAIIRQLRAENEKQAARIAELEAGLKDFEKDTSLEIDHLTRFGKTDNGRGQLAAWQTALKTIRKLLSPKDTQGEG